MGRESRFPFPGGERALTAGAVVAVGIVLGWLGSRAALAPGAPPFRWLAAALAASLVVFGIALWCRRPWARWPAVVAVGLLALGQAWGIAGQGASVGRVALLLGFVGMVWAVHRDFSPQSLAADLPAMPDKPLVSLVLLLRKPRHLEAGMLASYCESAWGGPFHPLRDDEKPSVASSLDASGEGWVGGRSPFFFVGSHRGVFLVHNHDQPYFEDSQALADAAGDLRVRQVLEENRGWLAVDFMEAGKPDAASPETFYPLMARLIAELAGPDCQAIYQPHGNRFNHWDDSLEARLRAGDVTQVFAEPTRLPVVEVAEDEPRMLAAVDEALRRWPEFADAFSRRDGEGHSVKVPLSRGESTEFIWVEVDRIDAERIHGRLGNDPVDLGELRHGSVVDVPVGEVKDWVYVVGGEPKGMFGTKVLMELQRERRAKAG